MIKSELIQIIAAKNPHLYFRDVDRIVDFVLEEIARTLEQGGRVELRGFGVFSVRHRLAKSGRNPRNGASVEVAEKWVSFFRAGKDMQERLNAEPLGFVPSEGVIPSKEKA